MLNVSELFFGMYFVHVFCPLLLLRLEYVGPKLKCAEDFIQAAI